MDLLDRLRPHQVNFLLHHSHSPARVSGSFPFGPSVQSDDGIRPLGGLAAVLSLVFLLALSACGDGADALSPDGSREVSPTLVLQPEQAEVGVGETVTFDARVTDGSGATLSDYTLSWSVSDSSAARVDDEGRVSGRGAGDAKVVVHASRSGGPDATDEARIRVSESGSGGGSRSATGADPAVVEDFSTYGSTSEMLSDPRGIYDRGEDHNESDITLDTSTGVDIDGHDLSQSMRYTFPNNGGACEDQGISRSLDLPADSYEVWVEWYARFDADFTTDFGNSNCAPAYKFLFGRQNTSRFDLVTGLWNQDFKVAWPGGNVENVGGDAASTFDGQWHRYRIQFKHESSPGADDGAIRFWVDETLVAEQTGLDTDRSSGPMRWVELGANINQGPDFSGMGLNWGRIAVWTSSPGW